MKHTEKTISIAVIIFMLCLFAPAKAVAEVLPKTAKLLPPETVLLVDIDNFSQLKKQFEETDLYRFYKDPVMANFVDDVKTKWCEKARQLDNEVVRAIVDANVLPQGRAVFALVLNKQAIDAGEPLALFIIEWGENTSKIKEAVDKQVEKAVEAGMNQRSQDYRGVNIKTIIAEGSSRLGYGFSSTLNYCFFDDCLIGSEDIEILKFVIAHIKGASSPTLADDGDYTAAIAAVGPYHDIDFYINIKQIIKTLIAKGTTGKAQTYVSNLGVDNVTAFACSIALDRGVGSSSRGRAFLKIDGAKKGVCKALDAESAVLRAPRFIPASAYSVTFFNVNIKKAYDELYKILYSFNPMTAALMHMPLLPPTSPEGQPELELKSGIIDHLGSQIIIAQSIKKPFSGGSMPAESLFAVAVVNPPALEKSLSLFHSKVLAAGDPDARRELLGHMIYVVDLSAMLPAFMPGGMTPMPRLFASQSEAGGAGPTLPQMPKLAFTFTDTHLILGLESTVEQAVRTLSNDSSASVASAEWFRQAKSAIPSIVGLAGLEDNAASGELFWWMMKQASEKAKSEDSSVSMGISVVPSPGLVFSQIGFDLFNFGLLPEFDAVRKYFGLSAFYGISRPDGFFLEFKNLNPAKTE